MIANTDVSIFNISFEDAKTIEGIDYRSTLVMKLHRRRSSVNFRGARHFCPKKTKNFEKNMYQKLTKMPELYMILARKVPEFYGICPKN